MEEKEKSKKKKKKSNTAGLSILHVLQHICIAVIVALSVNALFGSFIQVDTLKGTEKFNLNSENNSVTFEDSRMYNTLLGNRITDIICYGTLRSQMETEGSFDPKKKIDVTAYANRYTGVPTEYITATYYLEDLLKWEQAGFELQNESMTGEEIDHFLSRTRTITKLSPGQGYTGITVNYLTSDMDKITKVVDISGNMVYGEDFVRADSDVTILKNQFKSVDGKKIENFVFDLNEYYDLCENVKKAAGDLSTNYDEYVKYADYYDGGNSNVIYVIQKKIGNKTTVYTNLDTKVANSENLISEAKKQSEKFLYYDAASMEYETNTAIESDSVRYVLDGYEYAYPEDTRVFIGVRNNYTATDCFSQAKTGFGDHVPYFYGEIAVSVLLAVLYLVLLVILTRKEGVSYKIVNNQEEMSIRLSGEDHLPTEIMAALAVAGTFGVVSLIRWMLTLEGIMKDRNRCTLLFCLTALLISLLFSFFYYSFVRRIKAGTIWKNSLCRRFSFLVRNMAVYLLDNGNVVIRAWGPYLIVVLLNVLAGVFMISLGNRKYFIGILVILLILDGIMGMVLYKNAKSREDILKVIARICNGEIDSKVNETQIHGDNRVLAHAVNQIGESVRKSVETSMKDERMKADLITNVSHDIKTPLTSIINYVDLIKRQNVTDPKIREYIQVLDEKSQRLKQLTDDLVEASKISSGNIILNYERINVQELINQTIGEFSEKFEQKGLSAVVNAPAEHVFIQADSRRIWRIMENLFNNTFKYAMPSTRVYIDIGTAKEENSLECVYLSIKNISAQALNVNPEELTERFIRGDESRTTEGSGLGLSIAKNLTEAMHGIFDIVIDGDLFKVVLVFPKNEIK